MDMKDLYKSKVALSDLSFNDCLRNLRELEKSIDTSKLQPLRIAVLRSYTFEAIEPVLRLGLFWEGYDPHFFFGDYNSYAQEILDPSSTFYKFDPHIVLVMVRIEELLPDFIDNFGSRPYAEWEDVIQKVVNSIGNLAGVIAERIAAQAVFQNINYPESPYWGIYDMQIPEGQTFLINRFNHLLSEEFKKRKSSFIWDFNSFIKRHGYNNIYDPKMWYVSKNPFKQSAYPFIAADILKYCLSALGQIKKCIVLDLDNTLWGGIAGEDGIDGIQLGQTYPGNCFRDFQKELLKLYERGILLAINSKNNEDDALRIIDDHPDMILRRRHFAAMRINWRDKAANLRDLARELNIGIDSMIVVDDNPVECELIRQAYPECDVVLLPDKPYLLPAV